MHSERIAVCTSFVLHRKLTTTVYNILSAFFRPKLIVYYFINWDCTLCALPYIYLNVLVSTQLILLNNKQYLLLDFIGSVRTVSLRVSSNYCHLLFLLYVSISINSFTIIFPPLFLWFRASGSKVVVVHLHLHIYFTFWFWFSCSQKILCYDLSQLEGVFVWFSFSIGFMFSVN